MTKTILVVDDDRRMQQMLKLNLSREGYRVLIASNGREALFIVREEKPALILLDIMMPTMDGYGFLQEHNRNFSTPIIMLTAKIEETEKILGLEMGADDYVTKPFSVRELIARVRAHLRRMEKLGSSQIPATPQLQVAHLVLDRDTRMVTAHGERIELTRSEFLILEKFMRAPKRVYARHELISDAQGGIIEGYDRSVDVHIRNLRVKIEPDPARPRFIESVYGVGYRFLDDPI